MTAATPDMHNTPGTAGTTATTGSLLELIGNLQREQGAMRAGFALLEYARKHARARLGLLFSYDPAGQRLVLVEQCGHPPQTQAISANSALAASGLFGSALLHSGLANIAGRDEDPRCLPIERDWTWRGGHILLCPVGAPPAGSPAQGVMALCFEPKASTKPTKPTKPMAKQVEQDILLCAVLLASYLDGASNSDTHAADAVDGSHAPAPPPDTHKGYPYISDYHPTTGGDEGTTQHVGIPLVGIRGGGGDADYPNIFRQLATFNEGALVGDINDEQATYRYVLNGLKDALHMESGGLWLYSPSQRQFTSWVGSELDDASKQLAQDELKRIAVEEQAVDETGRIRVVTWSQQRLLLLNLLECAGEWVGAVAFVHEGGDDLAPGQRLLLASLCYAAAVIVRQQQRSVAARQQAIDDERSRIARDIHDGAAQQIAHVLHTLEYASRMVERQPHVALQEISQVRENLLESVNGLRQSIASLLPAQLEQASLDQALAGLLDEFRRANPAVRVYYEGAQLKRLPPSLEAPVYRVVQEALNNASKHARASEVMVRIQSLPGMLVAQVSDNGAGFSPEQARRDASGSHPHFGLRSMQERVEQAAGTFTLTSTPGEGTSIKASFPLPALSSALTSREREVLRLLVSGSTNRMIAENLTVSVETVKSHMHHIMQKLGVKDRTQAAVLAARQQWV